MKTVPKQTVFTRVSEREETAVEVPISSRVQLKRKVPEGVENPEVEQEDVVTASHIEDIAPVRASRTTPAPITVRLRSNSQFAEWVSQQGQIDKSQVDQEVREMMRFFRDVIQEIWEIETQTVSQQQKKILARQRRKDTVRQKILGYMEPRLGRIEGCIGVKVREFPLVWMSPILRLVEAYDGSDKGITVEVTEDGSQCVKCSIEVQTSRIFDSIKEGVRFIGFEQPRPTENVSCEEYSNRIKYDRFWFDRNRCRMQEEQGPEIEVRNEVPVTHRLQTWAEQHIGFVREYLTDQIGVGSNWLGLGGLADWYGLIDLASYILR